MFPKKLPSKIKRYAQSLEILSAVESRLKMHVQFGCPSKVSFPVSRIVVSFLNDMISSFPFQPCTEDSVLESIEYILRHNLIGNEL